MLMEYKIFICYASADDDKARYIHDCLARIVEFIPYKAERYPLIGEDFKQRLQWHLQESFAMIVLLTENGKNSQWVNQEIGYAYALKTRPQKQWANLPHIIPLSHKQVEPKGFITKDTIDILFLDNYPSFKEVVTDIIAQIRLRIPKGMKEGTLHHRATCSNCLDEKGFSYEWVEKLPAHEVVIKAIQSNKCWLRYTCPKCKKMNFVDIRTFLSHKAAEE